MAGVKDTNVIDVVAEDPGGEAFTLVMVEDRPWGSDPLQPEQLRQKISLYASWILDGDLGNLYPETIGKPVSIQLDCVQAPDETAAAMIDFARHKLAAFDIPVVVHVRS
jgi:hypothetical protein